MNEAQVIRAVKAVRVGKGYTFIDRPLAEVDKLFNDLRRGRRQQEPARDVYPVSAVNSILRQVNAITREKRSEDRDYLRTMARLRQHMRKLARAYKGDTVREFRAALYLVQQGLQAVEVAYGRSRRR